MTITLTREEAQSVLDALEKVTKQMLSARDELGERGGRPVTNTHHQEIWDKAFEAYTDHAIPAAETLRARLNAPEPEPVAWYHAEKYRCHFTTDPREDLKYSHWEPLYTAPPQREWQGLTDDEAVNTLDEVLLCVDVEFLKRAARAIEAKLKEKNI